MELKKNIGRIGILFVLVFFLAIGSSYAQRLTGKITGVVTDDDGTPLPGVTVEISSPTLMGGARAQVTSDKGVYRFINLPPGVYKAVFKLEGFQTIERENLRVSLGTTVTENIVISPTTIEESITVTAESPIVDVTKSSVSTTYDKDQLEKLPFARATYFDIVNQTAGFTTMHGEQSSRFTAYGSNSEENAMYLDGIDVSNPEIGTSWLWNTPDDFVEIEISGIGNPAEYGNFTGAVVNIVTKSGGNTFTGAASYYGQYDKLSGDNNPDPDTWDSYRRDKFYDISFALGGPIVKDKIWFYGVFNKVVDSLSDFKDDPAFPSEYKGDEQFFKLSAQITNKHKLVLFFNRQYGYYPASVDPYNTQETLVAETDIVYAWNVMYTFLISNSAFFELKYSGYYSPNDELPIYGDLYDPVYYDGATDVTSNGPWWPWEYIVTRNQANATLSYFAEDFLGGDHDFKIGVQFNRGTSEAWGGYGGGKYYYTYYGYPYYLYEQGINRYGGIIVNIGAFIDDSWKIGDRLTLNWGLRFDHHDASIPGFPIMDLWEETSETGVAIDDLIIWNTISPRIGLVYQLTPDQKTILKAFYGRYYNYPYIANWEWPGPSAPDWTAYYYDYDIMDWVQYDYLPGEMGYTVDPDLKNPYADQFSVGLERELFPDFSVGATFIYKNAKNLLGYEDRGADYEQIQVVSPDNNQTYTVWNQTSGAETNDYFLCQPSRFGESFEQSYTGLIFSLNKRYSHNWMMNASLTWSKAEGLNLTAHSTGSYSSSQSLVWYTGEFGREPNELLNARGPLNLDKRWNFKLSIGYTFPLDILVSVNYILQTGRPYPEFVRIYDLGQDPIIEILAKPKGDDRFETMHKLDFRIQKTFNLYKTLRLHTFADIFNLTNDDAMTRFESYDVWKLSYQEPMWIPYPRRVQIGLKLEF